MSSHADALLKAVGQQTTVAPTMAREGRRPDSGDLPKSPNLDLNSLEDEDHRSEDPGRREGAEVEEQRAAGSEGRWS